MWKSFENIGLQTSEKVSWEKKRKKHAQNIRSTVHRTGDLIKYISTYTLQKDAFTSPPAGSRGGAPIGDLGDKVPQKLNTFCNNCTRISRIFCGYLRVISLI